MKVDKVVLIKTAPERIIQGQWYHRPWLGLGVLAAYIAERGYDCEIIDMHFFELTLPDLLERVGSSNANFFGITSMTHEINRAHEIAKAIKETSPDSLVAVGGPHVTALPTQTLKEFPYFDFGVVGEGENTLYELFNAINNDKPLDSISGLTHRRGNEVVVNESGKWIDDLDSLPFPKWDFYPPCEEYPIYSTRGCPFNCSFCMRVLGKTVRYRSPESVVGEMEFVAKRFSPKKFTFQDETFTINLKNANRVLDLIIQRGLHKKVQWDISTRVNIGDLDFYKRLKEAGCYKICIGVESGNDEILKRIGKGITKKDAINCVELARKASLNTEAYYILGHPHETKENILETIDFAARLNTTVATFGIMVPYPGTAIYDLAVKGEGGYKIISNDWRDFNKHLGNALELEGISRKELESLQMKAYLTFYLRNLRIVELCRFVWEKRAAISFLFKKLLKSYIGERAKLVYTWR